MDEGGEKVGGCGFEKFADEEEADCGENFNGPYLEKEQKAVVEGGFDVDKWRRADGCG